MPLLTYREQFQDMKGRIDKCEARRADYDRLSIKRRSIFVSVIIMFHFRAVFMAKELEMTAPANRLEAAK